jgi:putative ribosome biogenesis GTPase RsgA
MKDEKGIKMTFIGNSGVGKSTFISNLLKPKNQPNDKQKQLKQNDYINIK